MQLSVRTFSLVVAVLSIVLTAEYAQAQAGAGNGNTGPAPHTGIVEGFINDVGPTGAVVGPAMEYWGIGDAINGTGTNKTFVLVVEVRENATGNVVHGVSYPFVVPKLSYQANVEVVKTHNNFNLGVHKVTAKIGYIDNNGAFDPLDSDSVFVEVK